MDDMNRHRYAHVYPVQRVGVIRESLLDKIKRLFNPYHPFRREKEETPPPGCWSQGWVYAYVPERRRSG